MPRIVAFNACGIQGSGSWEPRWAGGAWGGLGNSGHYRREHLCMASQHDSLRRIRLFTTALQELIQQTSRSLLCPAMVSEKGHGPHWVREESKNIFILYKIRHVLVFLCVARKREHRYLRPQDLGEGAWGRTWASCHGQEGATSHKLPPVLHRAPQICRV